MQFGGQMLVFQWPNKSRIPWIVGAIVSMFGSAYSIGRLMGIAAFVSAWTGTPKYAEEIAKLNAQAIWWVASAIALLFLAAVFLGLGRQVNSDHVELALTTVPMDSDEPDEWIIVVMRFIGRLAISILGTLAFIFVQLLISYLFLSTNPR
jgi:hypothetical protein